MAILKGIAGGWKGFLSYDFSIIAFPFNVKYPEMIAMVNGVYSITPTWLMGLLENPIFNSSHCQLN